MRQLLRMPFARDMFASFFGESSAPTHKRPRPHRSAWPLSRRREAPLFELDEVLEDQLPPGIPPALDKQAAILKRS